MIRQLLSPLLLLLFLSATAGAQEKKATYYADKFYGRLTSTGEKLDASQYTAASRKHDWGTILEVTNKNNGRTVQVRVNDCGPHHPQAVLDLSQAAAVELDMLRAGRVPVSVRVVRASTAGPTCHRGAWAKKLKAAGKPIPPPPPAWDPVETAGALPPAVVTNVSSDVTTLPVKPAVDPGEIVTGLVGFYPQNANKRKTSTGETYLHGGLTAASKQYPYNTVLQLTNIVNGKSLQVRVNDCGPAQPDRLLNISRSAAFDLGILGTGTAQMSIRVVSLGKDGPTCDRSQNPTPAVSVSDPPSPASTSSTAPAAAPTAPSTEPEPEQTFAPDELLFGVKLAAFKSAEGADRFMATVKQQGFSPVFSLSDGKFVRVYTGKFYFQAEAEEYRDVMRKAGYKDATVRRVQ